MKRALKKQSSIRTSIALGENPRGYHFPVRQDSAPETTGFRAAFRRPTASCDQGVASPEWLTGRTSAIIVVSLFAFALALRLLFVLRTPQVPVVFDAQWYTVVAHNMLAALPRVIGLDLTAIHLDLGKAPLYSALLAVVYLVAGESLTAARLVQAAVDATSCCLLFPIGKRIGGWRVGIVSALLASLYVPAIIATGQLLTETLSTFLLVLIVVLLMKALDCDRRLLLAAAGVLSALSIYVRGAAFVPLFLIVAGLLALVSYVRTRALRSSWCHPAIYLLGVLMVITPWLVAARLHYGKAYIAPPFGFQLERTIYQTGLGPGTDPWLYDSAETARHIQKFVQAGQGGDSTDVDYRRLALTTVMEDPLRVGQLLLDRGYRYWARPYNTFLQTYLVNMDGQTRVHQVLWIAGLFGLGIAARRRPAGWVLLLVAAYVSAVTLCLLWVEPRYLLPLAPFGIVLAACFLDAVCLGSLALRRAREMHVGLGCVLVAGLSLLAWQTGTVPNLLTWFAALAAPRAHLIHVVLGNLFWLSLGVLAFVVTRRVVGTRWAALSTAFAVVLVCAAYSAHSVAYGEWHQWTSRLADETTILRQDITLPTGVNWEEVASASLEIDIQSRGRGCTLVAWVTGRERQGALRTGWLSEDNRTFARAAGQDADQLPGWYSIPLDLESLQAKPGLRADVRLVHSVGVNEACSFVDVRGDYTADISQFEGPSLLNGEDSPFSWVKWLVDGDFRFWSRISVESSGGVSSRYQDGRWEKRDLSDAPGVQSGNLRIRLVLWHKDGRLRVF